MTTDEYRNPKRGEEDAYAVILLKKGRPFRVFAPHTKNECLRIKRNILKSWNVETVPEIEGYTLMIVQCWTDWFPKD